MTDLNQAPGHDEGENTVWVEQEALIDRIPRGIAMAFLFVLVVGIWGHSYAHGIGLSHHPAYTCRNFVRYYICGEKP